MVSHATLGARKKAQPQLQLLQLHLQKILLLRTKRAVDDIIEATYNWMHDGHNPFSEQDIKASRLPFDVKNWIEIHVEEKKGWKGMKDLLRTVFENEITKHRFDKQNSQTWIGILKEKGYDTLFEIINTFEADEKANGSKKELLMDVWVAPWQKKILLKQEDINLDSTHKTCVSFLSHRGDCYLFSLVTRSYVTYKSCPVAFFITNSESSFTISRWLSCLKFECGFYPKRIMIHCSVTEMDAILSTFGTEVQVLVCHWHIRREWKKKLKKSKARLALQILKFYVKKACVYLSLLMYAKDPEDFEEGGTN
ncbi:hypothetical protein INT45_008943 [Circinella minor]|uniref:MULE transposase domain-containing protein n=1 Tax=Circinella minor TaxID=1195481 RepID=A0A8H7S6M5_9FUNG|nr:hypothetical protein INT45_008943 [Circinella minor]